MPRAEGNNSSHSTEQLQAMRQLICNNDKKKIIRNNIDIAKKEYPAAVLNAVIAKSTKRITNTT